MIFKKLQVLFRYVQVHISGCEARVHAVHYGYENQETEAVILVDASNAFNPLNRQAALLNIQQLCPALSKVMINTYRNDSQLFIDGGTQYTVFSTGHDTR